MSNIITISELADKANGYTYGMVHIGSTKEGVGLETRIVFNESKADDNTITFSQVNQEDVRITLNKEDIYSIEDKSEDGVVYYLITLKSGLEVKVVLFHEKGVEAQICHVMYGSYNEFLKELSLFDLENMVEKTKSAMVSISDESTWLKHKYEGVYMVDKEDDDCSSDLVFFNGDKDEPTELLRFTVYDNIMNDIWLMNGSDDWDGLELRLYNQPFTKVRLSLLYK